MEGQRRSRRRALLQPQLHRMGSQEGMEQEEGSDRPSVRVESGKVRCDSAQPEQRLSICSMSGIVYETIVVVGHMYGSDNVVYYLLEVRSAEMPLEGYVIRRRYNDFKKLHQTLATKMPLAKASPGSYYSSLLCHPLTSNSDAHASSLWSPSQCREDGRASMRKPTITSDSDESTAPTEYDTRFSAPAVHHYTQAAEEWSASESTRRKVPLPLHCVKFDKQGRALLPPLPSGGLSSFFTTRHMLITHRIQQFNHILAAVLSDSAPGVGAVLLDFIQENPSNQTNYVTLSQYAPLEMSWSVERQARRRAASMGKKPLRDQIAMAAS